jgi:hypothetical protein
LKGILRSRGWIDEEIGEDEIVYFKHAKKGIDMLMEYSGQILKDGLINRYIDILEAFNSISDVAKNIINNLIIDAVLYQISVELRIVEEEYYSYNIGVMSESNLFEFVQDLGYPFPKFIFNEVKDMIISDLNILGISKEKITEEIKRHRDLIKIELIPPPHDMLTYLQSTCEDPRYRRGRILLAAYEHYFKRLNSS